MIRIDMKLAQHWEKVLQEDRRIQRKVLFKSGGFGRRVTQQSMRYRKGPSRPGQPPHAHKPHALVRQLTTFRVDESLAAVTIGPDLHRPRNKQSQPVPRLLDKGGPVMLGGKRRQLRPRPFVVPAFAKTLEKVPDFIAQARG